MIPVCCNVDLLVQQCGFVFVDLQLCAACTFSASLAATLWRGPRVCSAAECAAVGRHASFRILTTAGGTNSRFAHSCVCVFFFWFCRLAVRRDAGAPAANNDLKLEVTPLRAPGEDFTTGVSWCCVSVTHYRLQLLRSCPPLSAEPCAPAVFDHRRSQCGRPSVRPSLPGRLRASLAGARLVCHLIRRRV